MSRTVATVGVFDGVHLGHRRLLQQAAAQGTRLLAVTFDRHPLELVCPERAPLWLTLPPLRNALLAQVPGVTEVVQLTFDEALRRLTATQFMAMLRSQYGVDCLVMGYDHHLGSDRGNGEEFYRHAGREAGIDVVRAQSLTMATPDGCDGEISSSRIRCALGQSDIVSANMLLGRYYSITGTVEHGRHDGHRLGFPTANVAVEAGQMLPANGVYAAKVTIPGDDDEMVAMVNIGVNPTLTAGQHRTVEAHIIDFDGDLYGREITVRLVAHIRAEQRFAGPDELCAQLRQDRKNVLQLWG